MMPCIPYPIGGEGGGRAWCIYQQKRMGLSQNWWIFKWFNMAILMGKLNIYHDIQLNWAYFWTNPLALLIGVSNTEATKMGAEPPQIRKYQGNDTSMYKVNITNILNNIDELNTWIWGCMIRLSQTVHPKQLFLFILVSQKNSISAVCRWRSNQPALNPQ